jgi:TolB protein
MLPVGIAVAVLAAVAGAWMVFGDQGSGGEWVASPTVTTSPAVAASPTGGATPEPSPTVDGAFPVPEFPASAIPWDEVGPGWFLLSYDPDTTDDVVPEWTMGPHGLERWFSLADESLQLVSPTGDLYYVRDLNGLGSVRVMGWTGDSVLILEGHAIAESGQSWHGPLSSLDLATGATALVNGDVQEFYGPRILADGRVLTFGSGEGGYWADVSNSDYSAPQQVCYTTEGPITDLSPDGTRVVCLEGSAAGSDVMLYNIVDGTGAKIDEFTYDPMVYWITGWWDENSFVLGRPDGSGGELWWAYDVSTGQIRDLNATLSGGTPAEFAEGVAGYRVVRAVTTVEVQGFDGALLASLPNLPEAISGSVALTLDLAPGGEELIEVLDLESGESTEVGSFVRGPEAQLHVYAWPN